MSRNETTSTFHITPPPLPMKGETPRLYSRWGRGYKGRVQIRIDALTHGVVKTLSSGGQSCSGVSNGTFVFLRR